MVAPTCIAKSKQCAQREGERGKGGSRVDRRRKSVFQARISISSSCRKREEWREGESEIEKENSRQRETNRACASEGKRAGERS